MMIGVDFDNTIVCYDELFHRVALERGLIPEALPRNKTAVRDHLRQIGQEDVWTRLQGEVYGARMAEASMFPGVMDFFHHCAQIGFPVAIISHKTRHPFLGEKIDLHEAALAWIEQQGFFSHTGLRREDVFFELTKQAKIQRVIHCRCQWFIDDLPEILTELDGHTNKIHFDPAGSKALGPWEKQASSWEEIRTWLLT